MVAEQSVFRGVLDFFGRIGVYDIVLPFLLIFTIVFAILEKTKIFGTEKVEGADYTRKNLNAITAFVIAFLVISSAQLVAVINETLAKTMVLVVCSVAFLIMFGVFFGEKEKFFEEGIGKHRGMFFGITFVGIILIFLSSIRIDSGLSWLEYGYYAVLNIGSSTAVAAIVMVILVLVFIYWITDMGKSAKAVEKKHE